MVEHETLIEELGRAHDSIKPEPGMGGPHGGYLGGITRERAALAIEHAMEYLSNSKEDAIIEAALRLWNSQKASGSTLPPGSYGIGGQMITGWVRAEKVEDLLNAVQDALVNNRVLQERMFKLQERNQND